MPASVLLAAAEKASGLQLVWEFLSTGGFVMGLLVLCSMAAITAMILAWLHLREKIILPPAVVSQLRSVPNYASKGDIRPLQEFLQRDGSMMARLGSMAVSGSYTSKQECIDACTSKAREEIHYLERGIPLFAICRGFQEANVALGGSLHQAVQEVGPFQDHRSVSGQPAHVQYADVHPVQVLPGGRLAQIVGRSSFQVNSLHGQAVNRLAPGLRVEAVAPDGIVEAFSVEAAPGFNLCLQWHPEWQAGSNPVSMQLLTAFGDAARAWRAQHHTPHRNPIP